MVTGWTSGDLTTTTNIAGVGYTYSNAGDGPTIGDGTTITNGQLLGFVSGTEVRSPFAGQIMGFMAVRDERVIENQPIAWLRTV